MAGRAGEAAAPQGDGSARSAIQSFCRDSDRCAFADVALLAALCQRPCESIDGGRRLGAGLYAPASGDDGYTGRTLYPLLAHGNRTFPTGRLLGASLLSE